MNTLDKILEKSKEIDWTNRDVSESLNITFPVPETHSRYRLIQKYDLILAQLSDDIFPENFLVLCDESIKGLSDSNIIFLKPAEDSLKTIAKAEEFIVSLKKEYEKIIVIGGGVMLNFGGYVAERLNVDLEYVPTSIIAMSDASIGGKVRLNDVKDGIYKKHAYKSFYEPSKIILDPRFLETLNDEQTRVGLAEIIKHAVYQSSGLAEYLLSNAFQPFSDRQSLLRAIIWTADLKRICLEIDPEESKDGSYKILRAAHDISDRFEEESDLKLTHGEAVEKAMLEDLQNNLSRKETLLKIYKKFGINIS